MKSVVALLVLLSAAAVVQAQAPVEVVLYMESL